MTDSQLERALQMWLGRAALFLPLYIVIQLLADNGLPMFVWVFFTWVSLEAIIHANTRRSGR